MTSTALPRPPSAPVLPDTEAVFRAANEGRFLDVGVFVQQGFALDTPDKDGNTVLHIASKLGDCSMIEKLLQCGAQIDAKDAWASWTPLHHAVWQGRRTAVQLLLSHGSNRNSRDKEGQTPLHLAAMRGRLLETLLLIDAGATLDLRDQKFYSPLHCAVISGSFEVIHLLIQRGADKALRSKDGKTPSQVAESMKRADIVELFFKPRPSVPTYATEPSIPDMAKQLQIMSRVESNIAKAREELGSLKAADKMRRLEESLQKACTEGVTLRSLLQDREEKLKASRQAEMAALKVSALEEARRKEEEVKRSEADSRRRTLEKQMADAMHSLTEGEQCRADMEKQLKLEIVVREMTEARALEADTRRSNAEARLNAEIKARQGVEGKLKDKQDLLQQMSVQLSDLEKARMEEVCRAQRLEEQKAEVQTQLRDVCKKNLLLEEKLKEEQDKRQKADERLRKAEAYAKEEQRLRKEEEKARKGAQSILAEECKLRALAEGKALEEAKRRARAEIKAMAEEGRKIDLVEKLEEQEKQGEILRVELGKAHMLLKASAVQGLLPETDANCTSTPKETESTCASYEGKPNEEISEGPSAMAGTTMATSFTGDQTAEETPVLKGCVTAFQQMLEAALAPGQTISMEDFCRLVTELNHIAPSQSHLWSQILQCLQGEPADDLEELKKERDALRATLKEMADKVSREEKEKQVPISHDDHPLLVSVHPAHLGESTQDADARYQKLEFDLKDAQRKREEAETRCEALAQMLSTNSASAAGKSPQSLLASKGDNSSRGFASVLEKLSFRPKVHDAPDQKA